MQAACEHKELCVCVVEAHLLGVELLMLLQHAVDELLTQNLGPLHQRVNQLSAVHLEHPQTHHLRGISTYNR